ncbi:MAG TPA: thioredoxin domain-containing protein [Myxococcota bacterium]|nr:thioredoxin domain-containing protein [Myxococcota bacterium]
MSSVRRLVFGMFLALLTLGVACEKACVKKLPPPEEKHPEPEKVEKVGKPRISAFDGLNLDDLKNSQRENVINFLNDEICPCGCPQTFAQCLAKKDSCRPGLLLAQWTVLQIKKSPLPESKIFPHVVQEIAGFLAKPVGIDTKQAHQKGDRDAPFVIVEFADFECPACKLAAAEVKKFVEENKDVQLYFMHYPLLPAHQYAEKAAVAAEAAGRLGKFWEMHDLLFAHNGSLTDDVINDLAKQIFTAQQMKQFEQSLADPALLQKVNGQRDYGKNALKLEGTPTFFFDGRPYNLTSNTQGFALRLAMEKARKDMSCGP